MDIALIGAFLLGGTAGTFYGVFIGIAAHRAAEKERSR